MKDAIIFGATISWWIVLLSWPITVVVAGLLWGANSYTQFKRQSFIRAWINIIGMSIVLLVGVVVMLGWDIPLMAWLPSSWRPLFQMCLVLLPWLAVVVACINILIGRKSRQLLERVERSDTYQ